ncbi:ABC transporter ATP-binding protein [Mycetocola sp. JXN-3]|uniref:ABC transporter ATP-binding protein n=1 Tax=Mycetocola sp. JXN-3 TaxID=2116510 RepID=UPI00165D281E|nr:ABC transporter ATP-binding protein [Mycetocola sp. JXN-3]
MQNENASAKTPVLDARGVGKTFPARRGNPAVPVISDVDVRVLPGEFIALVGPSGSGKSTLLYCLAGLEPANTGEISLMGVPLRGLSRARLAKLRRDSVGFIFQAYNLVASLTVRENVALPARLSGKRVDRPAVDVLLDQVGLGGRGSHRPAELSGGQQQRVAIARVLAAQPRVVFADEPTGALDSRSGAVVLDLLQQAAASGTAVVMVTHDMEAAARADRVLVLRDGRIQRELVRPTVEDIFASITLPPATSTVTA